MGATGPPTPMLEPPVPPPLVDVEAELLLDWVAAPAPPPAVWVTVPPPEPVAVWVPSTLTSAGAFAFPPMPPPIGTTGPPTPIPEPEAPPPDAVVVELALFDWLTEPDEAGAACEPSTLTFAG